MSNNKNKYYIKLDDGLKVPVTEKVFKEYWKLVNRENYLKRLDKENGVLSFNSLNENNDEFTGILKSDVDVVKIVEATEKIDELKKALSTLTDEEREIIRKIYFNDESVRSIAKSKNLSHTAINKKRDIILEKLRKILKYKNIKI